ncbi:MAG: hypothetical protein AAGC47_12690 [Bacteroidota bacterium]
MKEFLFRKFNTTQRLNYLREKATYVDSRTYGTYRIHLYQADKFFAEVWMSPGTDQIRWIEVAESEKVADDYTKGLNLRRALGL